MEKQVLGNIIAELEKHKYDEEKLTRLLEIVDLYEAYYREPIPVGDHYKVMREVCNYNPEIAAYCWFDDYYVIVMPDSIWAYDDDFIEDFEGYAEEHLQSDEQDFQLCIGKNLTFDYVNKTIIYTREKGNRSVEYLLGFDSKISIDAGTYEIYNEFKIKGVKFYDCGACVISLLVNKMSEKIDFDYFLKSKIVAIGDLFFIHSLEGEELKKFEEILDTLNTDKFDSEIDSETLIMDSAISVLRYKYLAEYGDRGYVIAG